jgi:hypothetical protein
MSLFINGIFNYTHLYKELQTIRLEIEDMEDAFLVDEVAYLCEDDDEIDSILYNFIEKVRLDEKEREQLINFYVVCSIEDYLILGEDGEY